MDNILEFLERAAALVIFLLALALVIEGFERIDYLRTLENCGRSFRILTVVS